MHCFIVCDIMFVGVFIGAESFGVHMIYYYYITALLVFINLILFIFTFEGKKVNCLLLLVNLLMLVANLGYLAKALSNSLSEAIIAVKICYIGGCFIPPVLLWTICCIANVEVSHYIKTFSYLFSFIVFAFVLTIGYNNLYYKWVEMSSFYGTTILLKERSPIGILFYIEIIGNMIPTIGIVIYGLHKKNTISMKNAVALITMEAININLFLISAIFDRFVEIMPLLYAIDGWFLLYLQRNVMMYNLEDSINSSVGAKNDNSYIMFDNKKRFVGANKNFANIFPQIVECKIDHPITNIDDINKMYEWIDLYNTENKDDFGYLNGETHYCCSVRKVLYKNKLIGNIIEFKDDTDKWNYDKLREKYREDLEDQIKNKTEQLLTMQSKLVVGMANMVENRDDNTGGHIKRTSEVIKILIETILTNNYFEIDEEFYEDIIKAAPMHDLGKISIDDNILRKPGKLTSEEYDIMKTHAAKSAELVKDILEDAEEDHFVKVAANVARHHHERWDGSGYPDKLKGDDIPLEARIMAIADVYDALVSERCYKKAMSFEQARDIMIESMGTHFDPKLKEVFLMSQKRLENYYYYDK